MKLIVFILLGCSYMLPAQQYLYLKKNNNIPAHRFALKDRIHFKMAGADKWDKGLLQEINQETIKVNGVDYALADVAAVRSQNDLIKITGSALLTGGVFFTGIAFVNRVVNGDRPVLTNGQLIWGASLMGGGALILWASRKTYRATDGWKWVVIDLNAHKVDE